MRLVGIAAAAAVMLAGMGTAHSATRKLEDPNREICKSKPVVGSRLKRVRECHTAAEWDDMKLAEQVGLNRQQFNGADGLGKQENYVPPGRGQPQ